MKSVFYPYEAVEVARTDAVDRLVYSRKMLEIARENLRKAEALGLYRIGAVIEERVNHWTNICEALQIEIEEAKND